MNKNRNVKKVCAVGLTTALAIGVGTTGIHFAGVTRENSVTYTNMATVAASGKAADDADSKSTSSTDLFKEEVNLAVKGTKKDLEWFAKDYMGYILHKDYLYKERDFGGDIIKDSKKPFPFVQFHENCIFLQILYHFL